jgi:uncharacterized protein (DUF1330 family)
MLAYIIVGVDVHDAAAYAAFANEVPATLEPFGGRFLVRGGAFDVLEGAWPASRIVILEFPGSLQARAWLDSAAYQAIRPIRERYGETHFTVLVDGLP